MNLYPPIADVLPQGELENMATLSMSAIQLKKILKRVTRIEVILVSKKEKCPLEDSYSLWGMPSSSIFSE